MQCGGTVPSCGLLAKTSLEKTDVFGFQGEGVPTLILGAKELPKSAIVEVQGIGGYVLPQEEDGYNNQKPTNPVSQSREYINGAR